MQAKIIDFASDAITKQLHKIDKDDVKKIMANVTGSKVEKTKLPLKIDDAKKPVTSSEEYCALVQNEFNFNIPPSSSNGQKKSDLNFTPKIDDTEKIALRKNVSVAEDKCEKIEIPDTEAEKSLIKHESAIDTQSIASAEPTRQYTNEVQNFVQKKNIAQGMMDLALVSANCNQLRYVLDMNELHPYYTVSLILIGTSLALQVIVGLGLLYSNSYNLRQNAQVKQASKFSNLSIIGVFLITLINVLISTFNGSNFSSVVTPQAPREIESTGTPTSNLISTEMAPTLGETEMM